MMKKAVLFPVVAVILLLGLALPLTAGADATYERPLLAGQDIDVGDVTVTDNGTHITVTYTTVDDWYLVETHVYVGKGDEAPPTSAPGQFPYGETLDSPQQSWSCSIALADIDSYSLALKGKSLVADGDPGVGFGDSITIAAHAVVQRVTPAGVEQEETAWAEGDLIGFSNNWSMYFVVPVGGALPS